MSAVIAIAFPVFAIILAGILAMRLELASKEDGGVLIKYVFRFAMPAALFGLTSSTLAPTAADLPLIFSYLATLAIVMSAAFAIAVFVLNVKGREAGAQSFASAFGNAVFLGLPIALSIEGWARPFIILMLIEGTVLITIGTALIDDHKSEPTTRFRGALNTAIKPFKNPLVAGAVAGFIFAALHISLPAPVQSFFVILGKAAGPTALFALGLFLGAQKPSSMAQRPARTFWLVLMKLFAMPLVMIFMLRLFGETTPETIGAAALFTGVPVAIGAFIMASQYNVYVKTVMAGVMVTTTLALVTISIILSKFA